MNLRADRPNFPDSGDLRRSGNKSTWSFHERYASDPEFKRQVDEGRTRAQSKQGLSELKSALAMPREKKKLY